MQLRDRMNALLQQGVSARAETRPEALAVALNDTTLTYGELEAASNRLARALQFTGCRPQDRIAILMPKVPQAIIAMLGVLKAGAIYVPLDPAGPAARLARMLEVSECRAILAAGAVRPLLQEVLAAVRRDGMPALGWLDPERETEIAVAPTFAWHDLGAFPASAPRVTSRDTDVAHILFTSGSTGVPKGVMITHRSVVHFVRWATAYFGMAPGDRISQHPPLHFDLSTFDIFGTLWAGAALHLVPAEFNLLPHKLAQFLRERRLTQWFSVPSVLNLMAKYDVVGAHDFPHLRRVLWCGEAIPTPTLMHWMRRLPHARFTNLYGPTEATIASSYYTVPQCPSDEREPIPIGTACDGEALLVLDEALRPAAPGEIGELYIGGVGLSPGYWRDPEKTRAAFLERRGENGTVERLYRTGDLARVDESGLVYFLGRADSQIKSRGYRIELGEIETAVHATGCVRECAVVALPTEGFEGHAICCAYSPVSAELRTVQLREKLKALLPAYMLPAQWRACEALPRNANGKIDRRALQEMFHQTAEEVSHA